MARRLNPTYRGRLMIRKALKVSAIVAIAALMCPLVAFHAMAAPTADQYLLRVEVNDPGEVVNISIPLSLLDTVFDVMPKDIQKLAEKNGFTPEAILMELETLDGEDLVNVQDGEDTVPRLSPAG